MQEMESYNTPTISTAHNRNRNSLISAPSPPPPPAAAASVTSIAASESIATVGGGGGGGDNNIPPAAPFDPLKWMGLHSLNRHLLSDPVKGTAGWIRCMVYIFKDREFGLERFL